MQQLFAVAALWLGLAVVSAVIAYHLRIAVALVEICVGVVVAAVATHYGPFDALGSQQEWLRFLASTGAVLLTFLAGAELDPQVVRIKLTEISVVGLIGFLTPFYFLRAGMLVNIGAIVAAPLVLLLLFAGKVGAKIFGLYPFIARFRRDRKERWYYTLMMSTGLTFGTISALYGLTNGIISAEQYSYLVIVVIGTAVIPTLIASLAFVPRHLLPGREAPSMVLPEEAPEQVLAAVHEELDLEVEEAEEAGEEGQGRSRAGRRPYRRGLSAPAGALQRAVSALR